MNPHIESLVTSATDALRAQAKPKNKWQELLNSGFALTVIGGVIVSGAGFWIQNSFADASARIQRQQLDFTTKRECLQEFVDCMTYGLDFQHSILKREIWITDFIKDPKKTPPEFSDGRNFKETRDYWETLRDKSYQKRTPVAVCYSALAVFRSNETKTALQELIKLYTIFLASSSGDEEGKNYDAVDQKMKEVFILMGLELGTSQINIGRSSP